MPTTPILASAVDEARNCVETDVDLLLRTGAEVWLDRPPRAVLLAPRLCDSYNPTPWRLIARHNRSPPPR